MPVSVTIRDLPDRTHDELAARAARAGQSLQDFLRSELVALAERPTPADLWSRVQQRVTATGTALTAEAIHELRDADRS